MFKKTLIITLVSLSVCCITLGLWLTHLRKNDYSEYQEILSKSTQKNQEAMHSQQKRENVQKFIWSSGNNQRLYCTLASEDSYLLHYKDKTEELVEHMTQVEGFVQEKLYFVLPDGRKAFQQEDDGSFKIEDLIYNPEEHKDWIPMQQVFYIQALEASYYYSKSKLKAKTVYLEQYYISGHQIDEKAIKLAKPTMTGTATTATFMLVKNNPGFEAKNLKAKFYQVGAGKLL